MTARDRKRMMWLCDFLDDQLGSVDYMPTIRRMDAAVAMIHRMLADDDKRKAKRTARGLR